MPPLPVVVATGCLLVALVFQIVGIADTAWGVVDSDNQRGLFRLCVLGTCDTYGTFSVPVEEWLDVVRVFSILGVVTVFLALVSALVHCVKSTGLVSLITGAIAAVAGLFIIIEFSLYTDENKGSLGGDSGITLGHGFVLTVIAAVLCFFSTVLLWVASLKN